MKKYYLKSNAKLNLTLGINGKLKSGLHKIESLVSFIDLHDLIKINKINSKNKKIKFYGKFSKEIKKFNTIFKLLKILDKKNLLNNQKFYIKIKKNIPQKSGFGGGSMNVSSLLKFFIKYKIINVPQKTIYKLADSVGSDVKLGLVKKNIILLSNRRVITTTKKLKLFVLAVKPNFGCSTKDIYKKVKHYSKIKLNNRSHSSFNLINFSKLKNDLETIAFKKYPKLKKINSFLYSLPYIKLVRMTGSGSALIGYFITKNDAENAAKLFKIKYKNYWCIVSKTI